MQTPAGTTSDPTSELKRRYSHECALVDDRLYLFGGSDGVKYVPRDKIFFMNVRKAEKKWIRWLARCQMIPPPCEGARCVVIDKMIYSYGGKINEFRRLGIVYRLDPKKMEWIEVATPIEGKKPHERSECCLCVIGSRMIMFGGMSGKNVPRDQLQSGATQDQYHWSNDIYEFEFEEGNRMGMWMDLELSGTGPRPLHGAAMTTIGQHRALLHGSDVMNKSHSFVINLNNKTWMIIDFNVKPSPRRGHAICQVVNQGKSFCIFIGGEMAKKTNSDYVYVLDCDNSKAYQRNVDPQLGNVWWHTCHCVQNEDKTTDVIVCGEKYWENSCGSIVSFLPFDFEDKLYLVIGKDIFSSKPATVCDSHVLPLSEEIEMVKLKHPRADLVKESLRENASRFKKQKDNRIASMREKLEILSTRYKALKNSRDELNRKLKVFTDVLNINPDELHPTGQKLGSGGFAGVFVGKWRRIQVAVKQIHNLITSQRNVAMFRQEVLVCSRLRHPNIMTVCGAVMADGAPFQIVIELLEGSVSEVITAAANSRSNLTIYEQLSIALDMTSGISYLHQISPRPYLHGDIRPSNILVTQDMKAKVGDLGATHLIESSLSAGPLSPHYLAPERAPRPDGTASSSTLSSDVYSLGVSLIEIFTGATPVPEVRRTQLDALASRPNLLRLCSHLIDEPADRPSAQACFETMHSIFAEQESRLSAQEIITAKRLVKGGFEGDTHLVVLPSISIS